MQRVLSETLRARLERAGFHRAFTLIELLLVLVILAVLASVATPIYLHQAEKARVDATIADISNIKTALDTFALNNGRYPGTAEGLEALVRMPAGLEETWNGPYLEKVPVDKWGHAYAYEFPSNDEPNTYSLVSAGRDGEFGTADDITKLTSGNVPSAGQ